MHVTRRELLRKLHDYTSHEVGWFEPLQTALNGLTAAQAAWQPTSGGNSIWQILNHLNYYRERVISNNTGDKPGHQAASNTATFGEPGDPSDEQSWQDTVRQSETLAERWRAWLTGCDEDDLDRPTPAGKSIAEDAGEVLLHDAYHIGQIVLLRKLQQSWPETRWQ